MKKVTLVEEPYDLIRYESWKNEWASPNDIEINDYISDCCNPEDILCSIKLLIPEFLDVDGCILLSDRYEKNNFEEWKKQFGSDLSAIEKMLNHVHVYDLFTGSLDKTSDSVFLQLCKIMQCTWEMSLKKAFPTKEFLVELHNSESDYGPSLTFYQTRG
ncbi:hypothetical protein [Providencia rettgeri]|uniref:hypothetical protein n=1 Tax=Providencia rettgeri TaxID=587 RepID=UPI00235F105C|nr:hypothetical protein [Providencia rettgeri]